MEQQQAVLWQFMQLPCGDAAWPLLAGAWHTGCSAREHSFGTLMSFKTTSKDMTNMGLTRRISFYFALRALKRKIKTDQALLLSLEQVLSEGFAARAENKQLASLGLHKDLLPRERRKLLKLHRFEVRTRNQPEIRSHGFQNIHLDLDIRNRASWNIYMTGKHQPGVAAIMQTYLGAGGIAMDIGANVGIFSLPLAKRRPDATVHAFEPNPETFGVLQKGAGDNNVANMVPHPIALSDETREVALHIPEQNAGASTLSPDVSKQAYRTQIIKAVNFMEWWDGAHRPVPDVIKIDVEGHEPQVIKALLPLLNKHKPALVVEMSPELFSCADLMALMSNLDYVAYKISHQNLSCTFTDDAPDHQMDFLFLSKSLKPLPLHQGMTTA